MKKIYRRHDFSGLLFILFFFAFGCGFGKTQAEADTNEKPIQSEIKKAQQPAQTEKLLTDISSVVGTYDYDTEKDGEGFDNTMKITKADDGRLFVIIEGSYIYKMGETQTFKEAEGKGDAILRGNRAAATLVDEAGKPCRATIIFSRQTADVKIPDSCQFNIALGGVYKKAAAGNQPLKDDESASENKPLREVSYEKMMDFVNDFDAHRVGEEFIITGVPSEILNQKTRADEFGNKSYQGLYYLQGVTDDDMQSYSVLTTKAMIESLKNEAAYEPVILRMTAVITESRGKFDVSRLPLATKIEGFDSEENVIWTAVGGKPAKLNFTH